MRERSGQGQGCNSYVDDNSIDGGRVRTGREKKEKNCAKKERKNRGRKPEGKSTSSGRASQIWQSIMFSHHVWTTRSLIMSTSCKDGDDTCRCQQADVWPAPSATRPAGSVPPSRTCPPRSRSESPTFSSQTTASTQTPLRSAGGCVQLGSTCSLDRV